MDDTAVTYEPKVSNNEVSLDPTALYYGYQAVKKAKESLADLANSIKNTTITAGELSAVNLPSASGLADAKTIINNTKEEITELEETLTNIKSSMCSMDPMVATLFDYYDEQDTSIDDLLNEVEKEAKSIIEAQEDLFAQAAYYDEYITENSTKISELHKEIYEIQAQIVDIDWQANSGLPYSDEDYASFAAEKKALEEKLAPLTEEYATSLQDLMLIKQLRNLTFESAYRMYTQYDDFEEKSVPRATSLGIAEETETLYDGVAGAEYEQSYYYIVGYDKNGNAIRTNMEIALYHYENPDEELKWYVENDDTIKKIEEETLAYLTDEERKIMMYLYNSNEQEKLDTYIKYMQDKAAQRHGEELAKKVTDVIDGYYAAVGTSVLDEASGNYDEVTEEEAFGNTIMELAFVGFGDGIQTFFAGLDNLANADGIMSAEEYKTQYLIQYLRNRYGEEQFKELLTTGSYEISSSIGNMVPSVIVSSVPGCQWAGLTLMGLSATGNAREQALQMGLEDEAAWTYGILSGLSEAGLEYALGGIIKLASGQSAEALVKTFGIPKLFAEMLSEGNEESLQSILDPLFLTIASGGEIAFEVDWNEVLKSGIYGMITAGLMNTAGAGIGFVLNNKSYTITAEQAEQLKIQFEGKDLTDPNVKTQFEEVLDKMDPYASLKTQSIDYGEVEGYLGIENYESYFRQLLQLPFDETTKTMLVDILYKGKSGSFTFDQMVCNNGNSETQLCQRLSMAQLLITNPETFNYLVENEVDLFHGTNANALPGILKNGLLSGKAIESIGEEVKTGEEWSRIGGQQRNFISLTDVLGISKEYASMPAKNGTDQLSFPVIVGTTTDIAESKGTISVSSEVREVGVKNGLTTEDISVLLVPPDKVDFVKSMVGDLDIEVLPFNFDSPTINYNCGMVGLPDVSTFEDGYNERDTVPSGQTFPMGEIEEVFD